MVNGIIITPEITRSIILVVVDITSILLVLNTPTKDSYGFVKYLDS